MAGLGPNLPYLLKNNFAIAAAAAKMMMLHILQFSSPEHFKQEDVSLRWDQLGEVMPLSE